MMSILSGGVFVAERTPGTVGCESGLDSDEKPRARTVRA